MDWPNHTRPRRVWRDAIAGQRMHHGWILAGKAGLGKREFALSAARELVAEAGVPQPNSDHPDIIVLTHLPKDDNEEKKKQDGKSYQVKRNIAVAQIRAMQQRLTMRPTLGARRVIIIDPADDLETSASNALLKSLEEPPKGTFFILVAHRPSRLLPTIRSRCRTLRFEALKDEEIEGMLRESLHDAEPEAVRAAIAAAGGSFGAAQKFLERDLGPIAKLMEEIVVQGDPSLSLRGRLSAGIGNRADRARIQSTLDLARIIVAREAEQSQGVRQGALIETHVALVELAAQAPTYNFDPGLLVIEIGSLLARAAEASERADA
ncbi:MAG TPA: DNA polymerase III subunit delta' [Erythrobacter sp.]|nr:DNA polymerase III subunit delta' [Erythrobacter sp.]